MNVETYLAVLQGCLNGEVGGGGPVNALVRAMAFRSTIRKCARTLATLPNAPQHAGVQTQLVSVERYRGQNPNVLSMARFLQDHSLFDDVLCAAVHGSLASGDEIAYSDFDAFLIVRDETLMDPQRLERLAYLTARARVIMHRQDALQHHGWFVLPEFMLKCYSESCLPVATLMQSASLAETTVFELELCESNSGFENLARNTANEIESGQCLRNLYALKSCLSKFMLLPALFLHAKLGMGVEKRESFDRVRDFMGDLSGVMDDVSDVRRNWQQPKGMLLQTVAGSPLLLRTIGTKRVAPRIPASIRAIFDSSFRGAMLAYVHKMSDLVRAETSVLAT